MQAFPNTLLHPSDRPLISKHELYQALSEFETHFQELAQKIYNISIGLTLTMY
jgi:hypothetical protein